jgi:predicted flap endonuclease-1-like 5' DNA nuclease
VWSRIFINITKGKEGGSIMRTAIGVLAGLVVAAAGVALFVWLLWWLWSHRDEEEGAPAIELRAEPSPVELDVEEQVPDVVAEAEEVVEEPPGPEAEEVQVEPFKPDDLKRIEGIGPKISSVLQEAGITTYAQLAKADVSSLGKILEEADPRLLRLAKPATWPEQAALAAAGEWEALEALQNELKGGRRG